MKIKYFLFGAAALALGACSSDENENVAPGKGEAYVQFTVKLPSADATRSATETDGTTTEGEEVGKDRENQITSVQVILDDGSGSVAKSVVFNTASGAKLPAAGTDTYTTDPIKVEGLTAGKTYTAYAIVNGQLGTGTVETDHKTAGNVDLTLSGGIAEANKFLMTGKGTDAISTGSDVTVWTKENPLDCKTIKVERAAARFDYKDFLGTGNKYQLTPATDELTVTLTHMALTNVSKDFYLFKRVSATGTSASWTLGGAETPSNYVVDYNYEAKTAANWSTFDAAANYYNQYAGTAAATYKELSTAEEDEAWKKGSTTTTEDGYYIQTYCTENTIQADPTENQINGLSTGVIFKGEIAGTMTMYDTSDPAFNGTDKVYVLNGNVYGNWDAVLRAKDHSEAEVLNAFSIGSLSDTEASNTATMLANAGFTRYSPDATDNKYYTYYVYWNRHNDNGISNEMGEMEFAVVRNNVYKLAVTEISKLGHPKDPTNPGGGDPEPDPDEPDPTNPDEDSNLYLKVSVKVLPWTVRKNDIKF